MSVPAAPLRFVPALPPEETARAHLYGLLARLFYAAPDASLLEALAAADEMEAERGELALAWRDLSIAAAKADAQDVGEEYEQLFVGTGKAPVSLYTGAYTVRYASESPLAALREELCALDLERRSDANEPEDHIAALCDVMRHLIAVIGAELPEQKRFFMKWIWPASTGLCNAIDTNSNAVFYRAVAKLARSFLGVDHAAFEML